MLSILWSFSIWSKLERWKTLVSGCLVIWPQIKIIILKCHLLLFYAATMNHFLTGLRRAMKSRFYMTTRDNQLTGWTKKQLQGTFQSQACTNKGDGHCSVASHLSDPLQPSESQQNHYAQQIDEMHWKLRCAASIGQEEGPNSPGQHSTARHTTKTSKVEGTGLRSSASPSTFTWPLANYHFFKHLNNLLQGMHFHNQQEAENAFQEFVKSWSTDFYATGVSKLISHWQKCVDYNGSYFDK